MQWKNKRTLSFVFWLILVVVMIAVMPNLDKLVVEKGQITIPESSQSEKGAKLLNELKTGGESTYQFAFVFHHKGGLTNDEITQIEQTLSKIEKDKEQLHLLDYMFHTQSEQAAEQLISEDGTTILAQVSIEKGLNTAKEVAQQLRPYMEDLPMDTYLTGSDLVMSDFAESTQEGVKKTEIIAIIFIIVILIIIFRSPIVPLISLITVGIAYIISLSAVALLVEHANLPFSNFTQVFLVVVLFGIGTDYNILLFTRFKEEIVKQGHVVKAISTTYATAGKTVIYSGLAVFVGFLALFLAEFSMYQATAAVAIGVAVLLLVLLTLNPFFMWIFGFKLFWPIKEVKGHSHNKMWQVFSKFSFLRPFISIIIIALVTVPFIWLYSNNLNYNDLVEIDNKYESKQAVLLIEKHYDAGFSSPLSLAIKADETLATQSRLAEIDKLTGIIKEIDGVSKVYSVTRPEGKKIKDLYITEQSGQLKEGIGEAQEGVGEIHSGLSEAQQKVTKPQDLSGVSQLIDGTNELKIGASKLRNALNTLTTGITDSANGAKEIQQNLEQLTTSLGSLKEGLSTLSTNYTTLSNGFNQFTAVFDTTESAIESAKQGYEQIENLLTKATAANQQNGENQSNTEIQSALQIAVKAQQQLTKMTEELTASKAQYTQLTTGLSEANKALENASGAITKIEQGASQLATATGTLSNGLQQAQNGSSQIANESSGLITGLQDVNDGQTQLRRSLNELQQQMAELGTGLKQTTEGLDEIYSGLDNANSYLKDLNTSESEEFFIPQDVLEGAEFKDSLNTYMNDTRNMTSMTIILDVNPYTEEAMDIVKIIDDKVHGYVASSTLADDEVYLSGKTMANVDLQQISQADFIRSIIVMMIGIMVILLWVTRSAFQTFVIIGALMLTNFAALGITELITTNLLGHEALSWNVPFFSMIMLITLGVDYSIFFMMRFNESKEQGLNQIIPAAAEMGSVIVSAAIILGGTFAALIPSGIITLIQVAITVMVGLVLLSVFVMPMLLPAFFGLLQKGQKMVKKNQ